MVAAVKRVRGDTRVVDLSRFDRLSAEFMMDAIRDELSAAAIEENKKQMKLGNNPTRVVVDRSGSKEITEQDLRQLRRASNDPRFFKNVRSRISFYYTDIGLLADAVRYVWIQLRSMLRVSSGDAHKSMYIWCSDPENRSRSKKVETVGAAINWLAASDNNSVNIRILGPTVEYRRKVIYNPRGRKPTLAWRTPKAAGPYATERVEISGSKSIKISLVPRRKKKKIEVLVAKSAQEIIVGRAKRQFRDIWIGYKFTRSRESPLEVVGRRRGNKWEPKGKNLHIPEIYMGIKKLERAR